MVPNNGVKSEHRHTSGKGKGQTNNTSKTPMCLRCGRNSHTKYYCKDHKVSCRHCKSQMHMPPIAVHSSQEPHQPQMVRHLTLLALTDEASKHTHQICPTSRKRSPRTRRDKRGNIHRNPRPSKMTTVLTQHHTRQTEIHSHHHKGNNSISTHCPHNKYLSMVRLWSSRTPALPLHSDRWLNYISNTLRQAKLRLKLLRTLPVPHPSHPQ